MNRNKKHLGTKKQSSILFLVGLALLLFAVFLLKNSGQSGSQNSALELQLDNALELNRPTFVFLHSLDCIPCKEMMTVVADVYPEFKDQVVLIDVDVYDARNENILRRENLQSIPTLVFYNAGGNRQVIIGAMQPDQFRDTLYALAGN